jgi:hypothetical protein
MDVEIKHQQPVAGGWLSYCARARDLQNTENPIRELRDEEKPDLSEGRSLANRY